MPRTSEFGQGFIYNMVLFAKHREGVRGYLESYIGSGLPIERAYSLWFNGAGDHFYEFEVPKVWENTTAGKLAKKLQTQALSFRLNNCTEAQFNKFWNDFELMCRMFDKLLKVKSTEAEFN